MEKDRMNLEELLTCTLGSLEDYFDLMFDPNDNTKTVIAITAQSMIARSREIFEGAFDAIRHDIGDITVGYESRPGVLMPAAVRVTSMVNARIEQASEAE